MKLVEHAVSDTAGEVTNEFLVDVLKEAVLLCYSAYEVWTNVSNFLEIYPDYDNWKNEVDETMQDYALDAIRDFCSMNLKNVNTFAKSKISVNTKANGHLVHALIINDRLKDVLKDACKKKLKLQDTEPVEDAVFEIKNMIRLLISFILKEFDLSRTKLKMPKDELELDVILCSYCKLAKTTPHALYKKLAAIYNESSNTAD